MYLPVISEVMAYEVCGVGVYAASNTTPPAASASMAGVVRRS